ncbi:hypothetical protein C486_02203 [Natrinema gari JCM 14663]|uniref:Uncharacterized protein n=1 Tax=Natrinema gari JCM 14663 TaxID=1230459 RepID=L9ZBP3_9EURY|nr:hypothetical protein C486_02203 [Natrinema gari JCM 14663]
MGALLGSLPLESALGLITVEPGFVCREVKHEIVLPVSVYVFNMAAVCRACAAPLCDDVRGSKPIPDSLTRRIELVRL